MRLLLVLAFLSMMGSALADHPGERLDEVMTKNEPAFEVTDLHRVPSDEFRSKNGVEFQLSDMKDTVIILSFEPANCGSACTQQQALLAKVQEAIDITPMRDMVKFITVKPEGVAGDVTEDVTTEKEGDSYWMTAYPERESSVTDIADAFASLSKRGGTLPMVHIIDRGGRHAGIFHGVDFRHLNVLLYINGLTNAHPHEPSFFERILSVFE